MKSILIAVAIALTIIALPTRHAAAATKNAPLMKITSVSALNLTTNTWATTLSTGDTLQVELRALAGAGAPHTGPISDFVDQGWLPILGYYGFATFEQNGNHYYAHR